MESAARTLPGGAIAKISLILWTFGYVLVAVLAAMMGRGFLIQLLVQVPLWCVAVTLVAGLYAVWRRLDTRPPAIRWPLMALACLAAGAIQSLADLSLYAWLTKAFFPQWRNWTEIDISRVAFVSILYSWTFCLNATLFWALNSEEQAKAQSRRAAEAEAAAQEAKIEALRFQLNPHFLFNTLNAISSLVIKNRNAEAEAMTTKLASFLRTSFDTDPKAPISLADELATIEAYLDIEGVRFGERLQVEVDCAPRLLLARVPSFVLQPLVENAVKYAVAPSRLGSRICIAAREVGPDLEISVADTGRGGALAPASGTGVGLNNTRTRLAALYGAAGRLETAAGAAGFTATLRLPLSLPTPIPGAA
ncbi:sensor histidine kinase [Phenylobacterium sp.]|uniref:sensor histidine kinase n=1 Tax=Phenylobacterium sp. TaxID=1871053 RepID=UPI002730918C|nr:histidine kinase [Phenylobacterium sp.]MDP1598613.1 histidine kinase [Phenylobacterium sp.]MDP3590606.1 histidine kinase [Phenylobacterium sp.]